MCTKQLCLVVMIALGFAGGDVGADITTGLTGYWPLDGDAVDASGNGLDGEILGSVAPVEDRHDYEESAMLFPGQADSYIELGDPEALRFSGAMTLAAWIRIDSYDTNGRIIARIGSGSARSYSLNIESDTYGRVGAFQVAASGSDLRIVDTVEPLDFTPDDWVHIAGTYEPGVAMSIYINGALDEVLTENIPTQQHIANTVRIGKSGTTWGQFVGSIDDVRAYARTLSADDIKELYEFIPMPRVKAWSPNPADGTPDVTTPLFQWKPGVTAVFHNVYMGTSPELTEADLVGPRMVLPLYYHALGLEPGVTYYWRVDEVEADGVTIHTGDVWSFSTIPLGAWAPRPADSSEFVNPAGVELAWAPGMGAILHDVYLSTDRAAVEGRAAEALQGSDASTTCMTGPLESGTTYYWRVDEIDPTGATVPGAVWSFSTIPQITVTNPSLLGWWTLDEGQGGTAVDWSGHGHHGALMGEPQWVEGLDGGALDLEYGNTNEGVSAAAFDVDGALTLAAWVKPESFSQNDGRIITKASGTGENDHWWMLSTVASGSDYVLRFRLKTDDGQDTTTLVASSGALTVDEWAHTAATWDGAAMVIHKDGLEVGRGAKGGTTVAANPALAIGIGNHFSGTTGTRPFDGVIDDVRVYNKALTTEELADAMRGNPLVAWDPQPANNTTVDVLGAASLAWQGGDSAVEHDVYLGTDADAVKAADATDTTGIYRGRQPATTYRPPEGFAWGQAYAWRIDEVAADGTIVKGRTWSFTVADYLIVDDFESYNDDDNLVFETWTDGWDDATNGSAVSYPESPFLEQTIVHGGAQSMPFFYDNSGTALLSEAWRTWTTPQNWTAQGTNVLRIWVMGRDPSGTLSYSATDGTYTMTGAGSNIWGTADQFHFAPKQLTGDGSITLRVDHIVPSTHGDPRIGVMIRDTLDADARNATLFVEPDPRTRLTHRLQPGGDTATAVVTDVGVTPLPTWIRLSRQGFTFKAERSSNGVNWQALTDDVAASSTNIAMTDPVYIGLVVCSHVAGSFAEATYSNVSTTGNVTPPGPFTTSQDIGIASNAADQLYVAAEDTAGHLVVVNHPDGPAAVTQSTWTSWDITLSDFAGVNLTGIKTLYIGLGDRQLPQAGGKGRLLIDDIQLRQP